MAPRFDTVHHLKAPFSRSVSGSFQSPSNISVSVSRMWADTATGYLLGIWKKPSHQDKVLVSPPSCGYCFFSSAAASLNVRVSLTEMFRTESLLELPSWLLRQLRTEGVPSRWRYFSVCLSGFRRQRESLWDGPPTQSRRCWKPPVIAACQSLRLL